MHQCMQPSRTPPGYHQPWSLHVFRLLEGSPTALAAARLQRLEVQSDRMLQDSIKTQSLLTKLQTKVQVSRQDTRIPLRRVRTLS